MERIPKIAFRLGLFAAILTALFTADKLLTAGTFPFITFVLIVLVRSFTSFILFWMLGSLVDWLLEWKPKEEKKEEIAMAGEEAEEGKEGIVAANEAG